MRITSIMELYSNFHKKPRRLKGTYLYVFRYYIWGAIFAVSAVSYIPFHYSSIRKDLKAKYCDTVTQESIDGKSTLQSLVIFPKSSKDIIKEQLRQQKERDMGR